MNIDVILTEQVIALYGFDGSQVRYIAKALEAAYAMGKFDGIALTVKAPITEREAVAQ